MTSITIRDVPEATRDELAARAARSGRSLQAYLLEHLIEVSSRPDREVVLGAIRTRKRRLATELSAEVIVDDVRSYRR